MDPNVYYPPTTVQLAERVYDDFFSHASEDIFKINPVDKGDVVAFMCALYTSLQNRRDVPPEMLAKQLEHEKACEALLARNIAEIMVPVDALGSKEFDPEQAISTGETIARDIAKAMEAHIKTLPSHQARRTP